MPPTNNPQPPLIRKKGTVPFFKGLSGVCDRGAAERDAGVLRTGRLAKVAGEMGDLGPRKAPLGARANRR